jgi:hypothetical protein
MTKSVVVFLLFISSACRTVGDHRSSESDASALPVPFKIPRLSCSAANNGKAVLTRTADGQAIGQPMAAAECEQAVANASLEVVCAFREGGERAWRPTHISTRNEIGLYGTSFADCIILTANASPGIVCTNTGAYNFQGRKPTIIDDQPFTRHSQRGASGQQEFCVKATKNARNGFVCVCNGDFCNQAGWVRNKFAVNQTGGPTTDLDSCIKSQG